MQQLRGGQGLEKVLGGCGPGLGKHRQVQQGPQGVLLRAREDRVVDLQALGQRG